MIQSSSPTNQPRDPALTGDDAQLLDEIRQLWAEHRRQGLLVRHRIGVILNKRLGDPGQRQQYGDGVVERVSEELKIDISDISRFRRFAARFEKFGCFENEHPNLHTWTQVRDLIAKPRRRVTGNRTVQGIQRSLRYMTDSLRRLDHIPEAKVDSLRSALEELFRLVEHRLDVKFGLGEDDGNGHHKVPDASIAQKKAG